MWRDCFCVAGGSDLCMQDLYINHIMNETGATVVLRGRGSEHLDSSHEGLVPYYIFSLFSSQGTSVQSGDLLKYGNPQNLVSYTVPAVTRATCYNGYEGIYPQSTPLQQVALALRQASTASACVSSTSYLVDTTERKSSLNAKADARPPQKRKFQEIPVTSKVSTAFQV
ncbi:hypothetical protein BHE74_00007575 [Ensete ventricosum]|uniref:KHDC4/BBP-like KH-domain type I domain-containing protein n=1 Tax=Ensete ventricosum TaxID=4639 RepID=A0A427AJJ3_ENSVE|nr:hypothetical protein B296_00004583 [Ensete ventricosum]RWW83902.1 hypothetical protein BHE74_00007575 [Ensete ventricosum]